MADTMETATASNPRWDGRRVLFEVADGDRSAACTISANALQDLGRHRSSKPADLLACFATERARIGTIVLAKLRARTAGATGLLYVWSDDIDDPPQAGPSPVAVPALEGRAVSLGRLVAVGVLRHTRPAKS